MKRTPYSLNPVPSGGRIFLVSEFEYLVCDRRNLDPQDRSQCAAWEQIAAGQPKPLIGRYRYAVEWPDGRRASEYHTFEYLGDRARSYDIPAPAPGERKARNS